MSALSVRHLDKFYADQQALHSVNFQVGEGRFCALLGPNGAGKTTLFQILSGLFAPDRGQTRVLGQNLHQNPHGLRALGCVFQQASLDLDMSVERNLRYHASLHGLSPRDSLRRMRDTLSAVGLAAQHNTLCRQLSGGNRRKVELARALMHQPRVLLMDEASVGLDPQSRQQLLQLVQGLCRKTRLSVLWATHLVDEVRGADQLIVLNRGRVQFDGRPEALLKKQNCQDLTEAFLSITEETARSH